MSGSRISSSSHSCLLLPDLIVQEHLEDVETRENLPEDLHLEGVAVGPLHGRDPRVQPLRERDVGLPRRVVRPELPVHDLPAPFLDELPRRDHLPAGALRLVHRTPTLHQSSIPSSTFFVPQTGQWIGLSSARTTWHFGQDHRNTSLIEKRPPCHPGSLIRPTSLRCTRSVFRVQRLRARRETTRGADTLPTISSKNVLPVTLD